MMDMQYTRRKADHDVWYRPAIKPNGFEYYEYVLIFVDDILNISHNKNAHVFVILKTIWFYRGAVPYVMIRLA